MYDQGLLTWQFPGMTDSVENISWSFIIIHLINRKTMIGGGGGGGGVTFSCFFDAYSHVFQSSEIFSFFILKFNKYKMVDHGRRHISFHIYQPNIVRPSRTSLWSEIEVPHSVS